MACIARPTKPNVAGCSAIGITASRRGTGRTGRSHSRYGGPLGSLLRETEGSRQIRGRVVEREVGRNLRIAAVKPSWTTMWDHV